MNILRIASVITLGYILSGCATPPPMLASQQSSGIGISIETCPPIGFFNQDAGSVFFVKVDKEHGLIQSHIYPSNYANNGRIYLLNVEPGEYAAIASFRHQSAMTHSSSPIPIKSGSKFSISMNADFEASSNYSTYFPKELVEATKVQVCPGEFAFMGTYVVDQSLGMDGSDEIQLYYANFLAPNAAKGGMNQLFSGDYHYRGSIKESKYDDDARKEFLEYARADLKEGGWSSIIK